MHDEVVVRPIGASSRWGFSRRRTAATAEATFSYTRCVRWIYLLSVCFCLSAGRTLTHIEIAKPEEQQRFEREQAKAFVAEHD